MYALAEKAFHNESGDQSERRIFPDLQLDILEMRNSQLDLDYYASVCRMELPPVLQFHDIEDVDCLMDLFLNRDQYTTYELSELEVFNDKLIDQLPPGFQYDLSPEMEINFYWMLLLMMQISSNADERMLALKRDKNISLDEEGIKKYDGFLKILNI
tara:strand:- start:6184 stop:6654 length:471 start_codon:yes stop_codon:yes gene_type:complete